MNMNDKTIDLEAKLASANFALSKLTNEIEQLKKAVDVLMVKVFP